MTSLFVRGSKKQNAYEKPWDLDPGEVETEGSNSYDLESEEYTPDDYESDYYEDEVGDYGEEVFNDTWDALNQD